MSKEGTYTFPAPTPPPGYAIPKMSERIKPQFTARSNGCEHELDDLHSRQQTRPQDYDDAYYRWRRGVENDTTERTRDRSRLAAMFATCCCGSIWGIVAWVVGVIILVGGFTALIVKVAVRITTSDI